MKKIAEYITVRNQKKINQIKQLGKTIRKLRKDVKSEITNGDTENSLIATIVSLMDNTYERVGNEESAEKGHYGITGLKKKHITFKNNQATLKYVGKSNVSHTKILIDTTLVKKLKELVEDKTKDEFIFTSNDKKITNDDVNKYLSKYKITSKDIRGFHANHLMVSKLNELLKKNPIPDDATDKRKRKKDIYEVALKNVAQQIGHEEATLKKHYIQPTLVNLLMEDSYGKSFKIS